VTDATFSWYVNHRPFSTLERPLSATGKPARFKPVGGAALNEVLH
jgi:hypothetical protein